MKTRARLVLEKRFRQMANGKTLAAFSTAALLGLRLTAQYAGATGKLSLVRDSNDSYGTCPGGKHTYGVNMDGLALGPNPTAKVELTGEAVVRTFESSDVINLIPPDSTKPDVGPSLSAVTSPLAGGGFGGGVTES